MNNALEDGWYEIGQHCLRFEKPDIIHMKIVGNLTLAEVTRLLQVDDEFPRPEKGFFSLIDVGKAGKPNLEILKYPDILKQMRGYRAFVYYRAQFQHRTVLEIVQKISKALNLSLSDIPLVAFVNESEALEWIDGYRAENG